MLTEVKRLNVYRLLWLICLLNISKLLITVKQERIIANTFIYGKSVEHGKVLGIVILNVNFMMRKYQTGQIKVDNQTEIIYFCELINH